MRLGVKQVLTVVKIVDFGVYLGSDEERVLLPKKQVPEGIEVGDPIEVFLYKDSSDRMIATTNEPKLTLGELAVLTVADVGRMGAFLDWGLEKDLFLPFKEQTTHVEKGDICGIIGFSGAGKSGHDYQFIPWDLHINIFQIVRSCTAYNNFIQHELLFLLQLFDFIPQICGVFEFQQFCSFFHLGSQLFDQCTFFFAA